mmetsp:Transcript_36830/g.115907  ORF Transcript_36830/g.115907 Transcript_36830/m.115907 type:complete len:278 (-) Transcript_36830:23-856(-)
MPGAEVQSLPVKMANEVGAERSGVLCWDDYFMSIAFLTAMRSKDPLTQVGACIVNDLNRIIGVGYNGFPSGVPGDALPWARESPDDDELATKYPYVVHAELNAIMNKNAESCRGCRLYSTLFPCNECAKVIIQAGIRKVIYTSDKHHDRPSSRASRRLFELSGVETARHIPQAANLQIGMRYPEDEPTLEPLVCGPADGSPPAQRRMAGSCRECGCMCGGEALAGGAVPSTRPPRRAAVPAEPASWGQPSSGMVLAGVGLATAALFLVRRSLTGAAC